MPQLQLPIFLDGINPITNDVGYEKRDGKIVYYCGSMPVYTHDEKDTAAFKTIACQLHVNGNATQSQIVRAFNLNDQALKRWVKKYRAGGPGAFYHPPKSRGKATILTPLVLEKAQCHLNIRRIPATQDNDLGRHNGLGVSEVAKTLDVGYDTIRKAITDGRLVAPKKTIPQALQPTGDSATSNRVQSQIQ